MAAKSLKMDYFKWLTNKVYDDRYSRRNSYSKLLTYLFNKEFIWSVDYDGNRAQDGIGLRNQYRQETGNSYSMTVPCSILEMMIALSIRIENSIMADDDVGNRTGQWFWTMVVNLGYGPMTDDYFSIDKVESIAETFLLRKYRKNGGGGGLFIINNPDKDMRRVEIWYQMNWYLDEMLNICKGEIT